MEEQTLPAKFGSYSSVDLEREVVINIKLVQVNKITPKWSPQMHIETCGGSLLLSFIQIYATMYHLVG